MCPLLHPCRLCVNLKTECSSPGRLALPPVLPGGNNIRAGLFLGDQDFFFLSDATAATPATPP